MSALRQKLPVNSTMTISAFHSEVGIARQISHVRKVPRIDLGFCLNPVRLNHILVPFNANARHVWNMQVPVFDCVRLLQDWIRPILPFEPVRCLGDPQRLDFRR